MARIAADSTEEVSVLTIFDTLARYRLGRRLLFGLRRLGVACDDVNGALGRELARAAGWD